MDQLVSKEYIEEVLKAAGKIASMRLSIEYSKAFTQNVRLFSPKIADTIENETRIYMCIDAIRCARMLGVEIEGTSKESVGLQMLCYLIISDVHPATINSWNGWEKVSFNTMVMVKRILSFESEIHIKSPDLIIPTILGASDNDNKNQYLILFYRWASIVAKADGTITDQEQQCLSKLIQTSNEQVEEAPRQQVRQEDRENSKIEQVAPDQVVDPYKELDSLVGLGSVKDEVITFTNFVKVQQARKANGMKVSPVSYHCIFTGNPGTGKTTIARIMAAIYKDLGIIKGGQLIETDRSGLVGEYIGSTAIKTNKIIDKALDGILFIDEAYALAEGGSNDFGKEAIATLIKRMEDDRERLVVILAGYPQNMSVFLNMNPGIQSRISRTIQFPDYSTQELVDIFMRCAEKYEYTLSPSGKEKLMQVIQDAYSHRSAQFGNARFVRNLFERTIEHQANRLAGETNINPRVLAEITEKDFC